MTSLRLFSCDVFNVTVTQWRLSSATFASHFVVYFYYRYVVVGRARRGRLPRRRGAREAYGGPGQHGVPF